MTGFKRLSGARCDMATGWRLVLINRSQQAEARPCLASTWTWRETDTPPERTGFEPQVQWLLPLPNGEQPQPPALLRGHGAVSSPLWFLLLCFLVLNKSGRVHAVCLADGRCSAQRPPALWGKAGLWPSSTSSISNHTQTHGQREPLGISSP